MTDQDQNQFQEKPVYLDQLDDGSRPPALAKSAAEQSRRKTKNASASPNSPPGNSFLISVLLFIFVLISGVAALLLTGKIALPF